MSAASRRGFLAAAAGLGAATAAGGAAALPREAGEVDLVSTYVAGTGRHAGRPVFAAIRLGEPLKLIREPENDYDARAVSVWTGRGDKLGYVPRIDNQALANLMDAGFEPSASVTGLRLGGVHPDVRFAVRLAISR